ncbi:hypothetical protein CHARACLAT_026588 [Characodon lateralis]|uniref:Secreted protein n=1 Tax=Characodon lateralis TaxID=208331 RepID=A0ABU7DCJ8_9TELE|nr:hypothetical protein [Characodon lateralis]
MHLHLLWSCSTAAVATEKIKSRTTNTTGESYTGSTHFIRKHNNKGSTDLLYFERQLFLQHLHKMYLLEFFSTPHEKINLLANSSLLLLTFNITPLAHVWCLTATHVDKIVGTPRLMKEKPTMVTEIT